MGGQEFVVPPLTLGQLRRFLPRIKELAGVAGGDMGEPQLAMLIEIVTAAVQRNYPELTIDRAADLLDLGNAVPVLNAILAGSRLGVELEPARPADEFRLGMLVGQDHASLSGETNSTDRTAGGAAPADPLSFLAVHKP
jgi:hypothetical protein